MRLAAGLACPLSNAGHIPSFFFRPWLPPFPLKYEQSILCQVLKEKASPESTHLMPEQRWWTCNLECSIQKPCPPPFFKVLRSPGAMLFAKKESHCWPEVLYSDFLKSFFFFFWRHTLRNATLLILVKYYLVSTSQKSLTVRWGQVSHIQIFSWRCHEYSKISKSKASAELPVTHWVRQQEVLGLKLWILVLNFASLSPIPSATPSFMAD